MALPYQLTITVPFESEHQAVIAEKTLSPDPVLQGHELTIDYSTAGCNLQCKFSGVSNRVIRVAVSSVIDNIKTIVETMDEFDGKKSTIF